MKTITTAKAPSLQWRHSLLLGVMSFYAALLPFSNAFSTFTGPYLLAFFWLLEGNLRKKFSMISHSKVLISLWLFFVFNALSLLWSQNLHEGIHTLKYYLAIALVSTVFATSLRTRYDQIVVLGSFLTAMFLSEIVSYGIFLGWWHTAKGTPSDPTPVMHHVLYSIFLSVTVLLLLWQLLKPGGDRRLKLFELFFLISSTANLFLNGGRTGQLAFVLGALVFFVRYYGGQIRHLLLNVVGIAALLSMAYTLSPVFHQRVHQGVSDLKNIRSGDLDNSWGLRIAMKKIALPLILAHPLVGVGVGDILDEFHHAAQKSRMPNKEFLTHTIHVHDQFIQITLQTGLIGLAIFLYLLWSLYSLPKLDPLDRSLWLALLTIFVTSFFIDVPLRNYVSGLFAFIVGLFISRGMLMTPQDAKITVEKPSQR